MASKQKRCIRCGLGISDNELSLGSGKQPSCVCPRPKAQRQSTRQTPMQNITYVSATPTIAEQLVLLAKLRSDGALTEQEFQTLKNRLMSDENL